MRLVVAGMLLLGCTSPGPVKPAAEGGRAERLPLADLEAYALADNHLALPNDGTLMGVGHTATEIGDVLAAAGLPRDTVHLDIQALLVRSRDRVMLFDTGGGALLPTPAQLPQSLALAGVAPIAVTDIFISHAHGDHVGGLLTADGTLAFPAATIHLSTPEWEALRSASDADSKRMVSVITPRVQAFAPGAQLVPGVRALATPGHTPGHSSYAIGEGELVYLGDIAHHSVISVQRPTWSVQVDADHAAADALRPQLLRELASKQQAVFVGHFPYPGLGQFAADGEALAWRPAARDAR